MAPAARRGGLRWAVVAGLFVYCGLCWTLLGAAAQTAYRQFAPHEMVAQQGARADPIARR